MCGRVGTQTSRVNVSLVMSVRTRVAKAARCPRRYKSYLCQSELLLEYENLEKIKAIGRKLLRVPPIPPPKDRALEAARTLWRLESARLAVEKWRRLHRLGTTDCPCTRASVHVQCQRGARALQTGGVVK